MSSIRFVKDTKPKVVKQGELEYQAGQLSFVGRKSISPVVRSVRKYLKDNYGWTEETSQDTSITTQAIAELCLTDSYVLILTCDYTEELKPGDLLEWDEEFIDLCEKAILELNPFFKVNPGNSGKAQPETHNEDGTPKKAEEVSPLA